MPEFKSAVAMMGDGQVIDIGKQDLKSSEVTEKLTDDMMIFSDMDSHFSRLDTANFGGDVEERLEIVEKDILIWDSDESMIWDCGAEEASKYLRSVDEVRRLTKILETLGQAKDSQKDIDLLCRAHSILQMAMTRLEVEFMHLLEQCRQLSEADRMSFHSLEDLVDDFSNSSFGDDFVHGRCQRDSCNDLEEFVVDLIIPSTCPDINRIAEVMFMSNYDKECCQAYVNIRKDALEECVSSLHVEKLSIEEVLHMDWNVLYGKIGRWTKAMKVFIRVYLVSEKHLCDHIFGGISESVCRTCFFDSAKGSILQLLNFGEAIAVGPSSPEKLFRILDMYEALEGLLPDIEALFQEESSSFILSECHEVLLRLGESVKGCLTELKYAIQSDSSTIAFAGGGVHPLTKYVMNYIRVIPDYSDTLDLLLEGHATEDIVSSVSEDNDEEKSSSISHVSRKLQSITSALESSLGDKSLLYQDVSLQHLFLMNNIYYMMKKVRDSELRPLLGDDWLRAHKRKYLQHALSYERGSWNIVLSFLKDEGIKNTTGSSSPSKTILKDRFKRFNLAFEEIYKAQTTWHIPDADLREDLRISISQKLLLAYRTFMGRYASYLDNVRHREKYVKYSQDDMQKYILDLFEGSPMSLHNYLGR